ncbi:MAG: Cro/CI family transcriptional regulator [Pseudomonadota bacterium]
MIDPLKKALVAAGGPAALARALGVSRQAISQWTRVPAERVLDVERACNGAVSRHELRPDIYPLPTREVA